MTLIAVARPGNWPVLFGDLMISQETQTTGYKVHLPIGDVKFEGDSGYVITGALDQKLCLISPYLAVGWSGSKIAAQTVIGDMTETFEGNRFVGYEEVGKFFHALDYPEAHQLQMVGMMFENKAIVKTFSWNPTKTQKSRLLDEICVAGSGSEHFLSVLQMADNMFTAPADAPVNVVAIGKILSLVSAVLGDERNTRGNLSGFYGGGFEIVHITDGKFEKFGDVTYLFWQINIISPDQFTVAPHIVAKFSYHKDILIVSRADLATNVEEIRKIAPAWSNNEMFLVGPINRRVNQTEIEQIAAAGMPDPTSLFVCHYFLVNQPNSRALGVVLVDIARQDGIRFVKRDNRIRVEMPRIFMDRVNESVRQHLKAAEGLK